MYASMILIFINYTLIIENSEYGVLFAIIMDTVGIKRMKYRF